jgi:hypothetical protein
MPTVEEGLQAQVRNIEAKYGRSMDAWNALIRDGGLRKHGEIVAMLKAEHGMTHGSANRVALIALKEITSGDPAVGDGVDAWYAGKRSALRPVHEALMRAVEAFGADIEVALKKGYLSLRRGRQFALIQPAATRVDVGLILRGEPTGGRLESAATFNAMFTHRVRVTAVSEVDKQLIGWLREAYEEAGRAGG